MTLDQQARDKMRLASERLRRAEALKLAVDLAHSINTYNTLSHTRDAVARPAVLTLTNVLDFADRVAHWLETGQRVEER